MALELYIFAMVAVGLAVLGAVLLPRFISEWPASVPMFHVLFGMALFSLPLGMPDPDPIVHGTYAERLTEFVVIIALMSAGLKLDRRPGLRRWAVTWRMLIVAMPLTIAAAAALGWGLVGFVIPTTLLVGAVIAPTDPVLASEVMVEDPGAGSEDELHGETAGGKDETRFALTSEAGLNDGLAFPFTYLAIAVLFSGVAPANWFGEWFLVDVLYRIVVGAVVGGALGWVLAVAVFGTLDRIDSHLGESMVGLEALAGTLVVYGIVEIVGGYGFIGVFVAATALREYERDHDYHEPLHDVAEKTEQLAMSIVMVLFGGAVVTGLFDPLTLEAVLVAVALVFVVRPAAGLAALLGFDRSLSERSTVAFFGLRGIGSFYYLSYGLNEGIFPQAELAWALVGLVVFVSVFVHGTTATPVIQRLQQGNHK